LFKTGPEAGTMPENFWERLKKYGKALGTGTAPEEREDYVIEARYAELVSQLNDATSAVRNNGSHPDNLEKLFRAKNDYLDFISEMKKTLGKEEAAKICAKPKYIVNYSLD
jgi:hypothetical protein